MAQISQITQKITDYVKNQAIATAEVRDISADIDALEKNIQDLSVQLDQLPEDSPDRLSVGDTLVSAAYAVAYLKYGPLRLSERRA
jgi:hypothetical protein